MDWISVKERLPDKNGTYLVFFQSFYIEISGFINRGDMDEANWDLYGVTHWMPLPDPPKEGE